MNDNSPENSAFFKPTQTCCVIHWSLAPQIAAFRVAFEDTAVSAADSLREKRGLALERLNLHQVYILNINFALAGPDRPILRHKIFPVTFEQIVG